MDKEKETQEPIKEQESIQEQEPIKEKVVEKVKKNKSIKQQQKKIKQKKPIKKVIEQKSERNYWMIATIFLLVACLLLFGYMLDKREKVGEIYNFDGLKISKGNFDLLTSALDKNENQTQLCSISENKCVILKKIG